MNDAHPLKDGSADAVLLRGDAERVAGALPPLLAEAQHLASSVALGRHGRRRAGMGETFWQYRQAVPGDPHTAIDWRRSGHSDALYIRQTEWEAAQSVAFWSDCSASMQYRSDPNGRTKAERARLLTLSLCVLLSKAGERFGLLGSAAELPRSGETHLRRVAMELASRIDAPDFGTPPEARFRRGSKAVFLSDFLGPREPVFEALVRTADKGVSGAFVQILDETEETFPFDGRTIFESMGGQIDFETQRAKSLRDAYLDRLAERRADLEQFARRTGWRVLFHRTSQSPRSALMWLYVAIGGVA